MTLTGINIRFLYLICGAKYGGFSSVQVYPKSYCIQHKTKRYSFHPYRLMFIFCQRRRHDFHTAFFLLESVHWIVLPVWIDSHHAILSEKLLHPRKAKRYSFHPYRLTFIFSQRRQHGCRMAFFLPESMHWIISPVWIDFHHAIIQRKTKATGIHPNLCIELLRQCRQF